MPFNIRTILDLCRNEKKGVQPPIQQLQEWQLIAKASDYMCLRCVHPLALRSDSSQQSFIF